MARITYMQVKTKLLQFVRVPLGTDWTTDHLKCLDTMRYPLNEYKTSNKIFNWLPTLSRGHQNGQPVNPSGIYPVFALGQIHQFSSNKLLAVNPHQFFIIINLKGFCKYPTLFSVVYKRIYPPMIHAKQSEINLPSHQGCFLLRPHTHQNFTSPSFKSLTFFGPYWNHESMNKLFEPFLKEIFTNYIKKTF